MMVVLAVAVALLLSRTARAETPRLELGPKLELGSRALALGDGRLLTCFGNAGSRCEIVDPLTAERRAAVVANPGVLDGAVALSDGQLLLPSTEQLLDPESGATRALPPAGRPLASLRGIPLSGGRAAFVTASPSFSPPPDGGRLLLYLGLERGFRELDAGPPGTRVQGVFDLEDGRLLVTREVLRRSGRRDLELLLLGTQDWTWQRGASFPFRLPLAAYRKGNGIVLLLVNGGVETLTVDAAGGSPRFSMLARAYSGMRAAHRIDDERTMLFGAYTNAVLWDASRGRLVEPPWPAPEPRQPVVVRRGGRFAVVDGRGGHVFLWSPNPAPYQTPCDAAFGYAEVVLAKPPESSFDGTAFEALLRIAGPTSCADYLEQQGKLPDFLRLSLEALAARKSGRTTNAEEAAAQFVCTLSPTFAASLIGRINRPGMLRPGLNDHCREATEKIPVLAVARARGDVAAALVRAGFDRSPDRSTVKRWVVPLLRERPDIARRSSRLLLAAHEQPAQGFDALRDGLCRPVPSRELRDACERTGGAREGDFERSAERRTALVRLGVATGVIGGLGTLSYVGRNDDLGRGVAIGSGIAVGGGLAGVITLSAAGGGDTAGLFGLLLAVPMTALGAVGGGVLAAKVSEKPGTPRFAAAAVPLSAALLTTGLLTIPDL
jgi:hypothetical protein